MENASQLKRWIKEGEGSQLEFKLKANHPDKIMREVVAFANTDGGILLLGVDDDGQLKGLKFPVEDKYVMESAFNKYLSGEVVYSVDVCPLENGREILIYHIEKSPDKIIRFKENGEEKVYVRIKDKSVKASLEVRQILKGRLKAKPFGFEYGDKEGHLMRYLGKNQRITLSKFIEIAGIDKKTASRTLVLLVLCRVLRVLPGEDEDLYEMIESTLD